MYKNVVPFGYLLIANARERQSLLTPLEYCTHTSTLKIRDKGLIYLYHQTTKRFRQFVSILFSRNFTYAKFRKTKNPHEKFPNFQ